MAEWFEEWFGEEYLHLYPHRDDSDAETLVALLRRSLPWVPGWRTLDVGCGTGRHAAALARAGARVTGLDLSWSLLARAHSRTSVPLVRADMRTLPIRPGSMDLVVNLFTSFGYFVTDLEHSHTIAGMLACLRPDGWFALDFLHAEQVRQTLVPAEQATLAGTPVEVRRQLSDDGRFVVKTIITAEGRRFMERVRLFAPADLVQMIEAGGGTVRQQFGDYQGGPLSADAPRCILLASRS